MIEVSTDNKSDCFVITQTKHIGGIDFHSQMSLSRGEMAALVAKLKELKFL